MKLIQQLIQRKSYYLPLLLVISIASHFPFVLKGFGEIDATKIAVSVIDMINHGSDAAFANFYFTDVIPLYILYLKWCMKVLNYDYSYLPMVMNYTNAVFGTLAVIPAFFLISRLFSNPTIAFFTVLALIFAPSFYQSTIMGFPHLIAFFFLLVSLCFHLSGLEHNRKRTVYLLMFLSCIFLTVSFLFKSDYVLAAGTYIGFLFMRKVKDKRKIVCTFLIILISGFLFLQCRDLILGSTIGATMSKDAISKWYDYSIAIPRSLMPLTVQIEPVAYGAGIVTFCLGIISLIYYFFKKRLDILTLIISWAAVPTLFWIVMIGNNARHNMLSILPVLAMIVVLFFEKAPRFVVVLTGILIWGNFYAVSPSPSILRPSGNLFKSHAMLEDRMAKFQAGAKEIVDLDDNKIVVLGYFHNPHVIFNILSSKPSYEAVKIGREDYKIKTGNKEYVFIYFADETPEEMKKQIGYILNKYNLHDYVFVSVTFNLEPLHELGLKTEPLDIIKKSSI